MARDMLPELETKTYIYNDQEVFNIVYKHLLSADGRSVCKNSEENINVGDSHFVCAYRGEKGRKCAVGVLIPDSMYDTSMESINIRVLIREERLGNLFLYVNPNLLYYLQLAHDCEHNWNGLGANFYMYQALQEIANMYGLTVPMEKNT